MPFLKAPRCIAYAILRATVGFVFLFYGVGKFITGITVVAAGMQHDFAKTWLPSAAVYPFTLALPFFEVIAGTLLVVGLFTGFAAALAGLLVMSLTIGLTVAGSSQGVALNLVYALVLFVLLYLEEGDNKLSVDHLRKPL